MDALRHLDPTDSPTVLVVDDEAAVRIVASRILYEAGYQVLIADSGEDALRLLDGAGPIHVLLSDLRMQGMTGVQLAIEVQRIRPDASVLLMAGYPTEDPLAWTVLVKPFSSCQLVTEIQRLLGPDAAASVE